MNSKTKVVIVGAGIAGLGAAQALLTNGFEVMVVEARDRCGGRIWVDDSLGIPLARGATWIHGIDHNPMMQLAQKSSTRYFALDYQKMAFFDRNGHPIAQKKVTDFDNILNDALQKAQQFAFQQQEDSSLANALASIAPFGPFSPLEQDLFVRKLRFFENYLGAEYELLSARYWDEEEFTSGAHVILKDGYSAIISELAQGYPIRLNTQVQLIQETIENIIVHTDREKIYADVVLITVPLGVLKAQKLKFDPELSTVKKTVIQRLGMGLLNIIMLKFPNCFWPRAHHGFFLPTATTCPVFFNLTDLVNQPILLGCTGGKTAQLLENETDQQIITKVIRQWQVVFPNITKPEKYFLTRWSQDPYSFGSYSYLPVGATGQDRDLLAAPESNRLFFAGEATHRHFPATTHGAYLSGLREAKRIQHILGA
ncbi:MAG: FAD-dependent oxidoreductase [Proteobacteria bacterium]|nr:FAD-dependent oxidoreductase [Pseudomonadota bacterium]